MERIGLLHGGALGDFVLTWHLLRAVGRARPDVQIQAWARPPMCATGPGLWGLHRLIDLEACGLHPLFAEEGAASGDLAAQLAACDLVINCLTDESAALTRNLRRYAGGTVVCLSTTPQPDSSEHITTQWMSRLRACGVSVGDLLPSELSIGIGRAAEKAGDSSPGPVMIHPGSGSRDKCWPLSEFLRLDIELRRRGASVAFVIGPVERERLTEAELASIRARPCVECPSLQTLIGLMSAATVWVGNDSGTTHLAAAVPGLPVISLFGATDPAVWRALGRNVEVLGIRGRWPDVKTVFDRVLGPAAICQGAKT